MLESEHDIMSETGMGAVRVSFTGHVQTPVLKNEIEGKKSSGT